jgi:uncharacterized protein YecT (DUF1311 family)
MAEIKTLQFPNTPRGQAEKVRILQWETSQGWRVVSETIIPGKFRGGQACCLFLIFAPCAFLAGHTDDVINVTLQRDVPGEGPPGRSPAYDRAKWAALLQYDPDIAAAAQQLRGQDPKWIDELASAYLTLNDKNYLPGILARISQGIGAEAAERSAARAREEERKRAAEQERLRIELENRERRARFVAAIWGTRERRILTVGVCVLAIVLVILLISMIAAHSSAGSQSVTQAGPPVAREDAGQAVAAVAPSFDCSRVRSEVLRLVCTTPELAQRDREMAAAYRAAMAVVSSKADLRRSQRAWILARNNSVAETHSLDLMYRDRTAFLRSLDH